MRTVVLGLDVGRARIGVARGERGSTLAFGRGAIERRGGTADVEAVRALAEAEGAAVIVVGLPRPTRGAESAQTGLVRAFADRLREAGLAVVFEDERFSTALSERRLRDSAQPRVRRRSKGAVDEASAVVILESYLARADAAREGASGGSAPERGRDPGPSRDDEER